MSDLTLGTRFRGRISTQSRRSPVARHRPPATLPNLEPLIALKAVRPDLSRSWALDNLR